MAGGGATRRVLCSDDRLGTRLFDVPRAGARSRARAAAGAGRDDPNVFWRQWLAGRNLGLVPIDEPASFAWPGYWIAAVTTPDGHRDAVLMFGVPSGPLLDPAGLLARRWLARRGSRDRAVPARSRCCFAVRGARRGGRCRCGAAGRTGRGGSARTRRPSPRPSRAAGSRATATPTVAGTFSGSGRGYELTLIEAEALEALAADGVEISWEEARRNVVTRGIGLNALVGRRFRIGDVECVGRRLAEPCSHLQRLAPPGILAGLVHRGGSAGRHPRGRHDPGRRSCG